MLRPRITPCLLIHQNGLVKTVKFNNPKYVGDPINAVKIFNEKEADELIVLDIDATVRGLEPNLKQIANLAAECRMPLCYGGGVTTPEQATNIIALGVEKVAISSAAVRDPEVVFRTAESIGKQSVVVVLDVREKIGLGANGYQLFTRNGRHKERVDVFELVKTLEEAGAGEIIINSIDRDGVMAGYDISLAVAMQEILNIPVTMLGGAGSFEDIQALIGRCGLIGAAAGSLFVFKGSYRAVLINYPTQGKKNEICERGLRSYSLDRV